MVGIKEPIVFKNLEHDPNKPLSKEFITRSKGKYYRSEKYKQAVIVSPREMIYEYIVDGNRIIDMGTFKPKLLDNLASFINRMRKEPNEWELQDIIKSSLSVKDYGRIAPR
jgi:hypothetical protein